MEREQGVHLRLDSEEVTKRDTKPVSWPDLHPPRAYFPHRAASGCRGGIKKTRDVCNWGEARTTKERGSLVASDIRLFTLAETKLMCWLCRRTGAPVLCPLTVGGFAKALRLEMRHMSLVQVPWRGKIWFCFQLSCQYPDVPSTLQVLKNYSVERLNEWISKIHSVLSSQASKTSCCTW